MAAHVIEDVAELEESLINVDLIFIREIVENATPLLIILAILSIVYFIFYSNIVYIFLHKPDEHSSQHGGELVAQVLKAHGVKFVFTLSGGHISPILVACEKIGIKIVDTRHEVSAAFAADCVARLSGGVGVVVVTAGPGVTNTVTAVKNAQMAESPVLVLGGAASSLLKGRGSLQDIDQLSLFRSITKEAVTVGTVREVVPAVRRALHLAQSGTPGPVFLEFPIDVLYPYKLVEKEIGAGAQKAKNLQQRIANMYLRYYLNNLFAGAFHSHDVSPLPVDRPVASDRQVQQCVELLTRSKRPVMLVGSQATLPSVPVDRVREAVERVGVPCYLGGMSRGLLGRAGRTHMRQRRREALQEADVIVLVGVVCDFRLQYGRSLGRGSQVISVNRDRRQLYKNSDMFWKPRVAIQGDAGTFLVQLEQALGGAFTVDPGWLDTLRGRDEGVEEGNRQKASLPTDRHLNPLKLLYKVEEVMAEDSIIVADGGDFVGSAAYILRPRAPLGWLDPGPYGTLGCGAGFALGAKLVHPDSEVWVIYGDGALGFSVAEFDTFRRFKTPVIAVVGNDACWQQISRAQVQMFGSNVACALEYSDYHRVAEGFGACGVLLEKKDDDALGERLREARARAGQGSSVLINALIGKTDFREGSISV